MKRIHKTINTVQILHNDIVGLMYDIKEVVTTYRGNLIALCVGIAVAVFNQNRHNPGMFFILIKVYCKIYFFQPNLSQYWRKLL